MPNPVTAPWILTGVVRLSATIAAAFGVAIVVVDDIRFYAPSFASMLSVPGAPASWGVALFVAAVATLLGSLTGRRRMTKVGLIGITSWCFFFGISFGITFFQDDRAAVTGVFAYVWLAAIHGCLSALYEPRR